MSAAAGARLDHAALVVLVVRESVEKVRDGRVVGEVRYPRPRHLGVARAQLRKVQADGYRAARDRLDLRVQRVLRARTKISFCFGWWWWWWGRRRRACSRCHGQATLRALPPPGRQGEASARTSVAEKSS